MNTNINIYKYTKFLESNNNTPTILYHGSPYILENFKDTVTFFTDKKQFAHDYSEQKSIDAGIDNDTNMYTVELLPGSKIFDINNSFHYEKLKRVLPNVVTAYLTNFGFPTDIDRDTILELMRGIDVVEPLDNIERLNINDKFPNPEYKIEKYIVFKKDSEYVYAYLEKDLKNLLEMIPKDSPRHSNGYIKSWELGKPVREFLNSYIEENTNKKYIHEDTRLEYFHAFMSDMNNFYGIEVSKDDKDKFMKIYNTVVENIKEDFLSKENENNYSKFSIKPKIVKLSDTWQFFENETINKYISKLGFIGYVALERNTNTYAIFKPSKAVKIIKYEIPLGREFDTFEQYKEFIQYSKKAHEYIADNNNSNSNSSIRIYSKAIYTAFMDGLSMEEMYNLLKGYQ